MDGPAPATGESGDSPVEPKSYERLSTQLSALLAEMVRTQEVAVAESWAPEVQPGGSIGRFRLVRELGRGGFGVVYEAEDGELNRTVALKVVKPGTRIAARGNQWLMREAEAVARLNHPNIVTLHDFGQGPTGPYLVFEMLRGQSLAERCRSAPLPLDEVLEVGIAVSRALVHAHGAGVIHRDLTAANVHLAPDGAVKVLDFGLAHLFGRDGANDGGTPAYMAPEQWEGDQGDARTDLFALGVILYQALTGAFPYQVDKGWSEALEPGETPRLPSGVGPRRLRRLVRSLLDREPELRPAHARAVRDTLLALRHARDSVGRRRVMGAALGVAGVALATAGWLLLHREAPAGEQVKVVVAAMDGAGEPGLEAVPGLLATALEPSPRVRVVPPSRLSYVSRAAGLGVPARIDAESGRELARLAGAAVLLVPRAWQEDGRSTIAVRAVESETGRALFEARTRLERPSELAGAVDRLSDRVRRELNERSPDRKLRVPVAEAVTASPEAARFYYEGLDCVARPDLASDDEYRCVAFFERALALDPTFPLAHYQLADLSFRPGNSGEVARPHLRAALEAIGRLPAREAQLVRALVARVDGRSEEALQIYDQLLAVSPEDAHLLRAAEVLHGSRDEWLEAARYAEKLVTVEPDRDDAWTALVSDLGLAGQLAGVRRLVARLEPEAPRRAGVLVEGYVWLGERDAAVRVARRAVDEFGDRELDTLRYALQAAGDYLGVEEVGRRMPPGPIPRLIIETSLTAQGRLRAALQSCEEATERRAAESAWRKAIIAAVTGDPRRVWAYAARAQALDPEYAADLATVLALLGDLRHADQLAPSLDRIALEEYQAARAWKMGEATSAAATLARLEARNPWPSYGLAPAYLLAELSASTGDDLGTLAAVERFRRLPPNRFWRAWAYPRSLLLSAEAHLHLGDGVAARADLDQLLGLMARADPDLPIVKRARALRKRLSS